MPDLNKIIEDLSSLTVVEAAELSKQWSRISHTLPRSHNVSTRWVKRANERAWN